MFLLPNLIFVPLFLVLTVQNILTSEVFFDRVELLNASYVKDLYNVSTIRVNKFNRTTYVLNMEFEKYIEMNDKIQLEIKFYYNRFNNNQYTKSLIRVPKDSMCKTYDKFGPTIMAGTDETVTNLPYPRKLGEHFCPAQKVNFYFFFNFSISYIFITIKHSIFFVRC